MIRQPHVAESPARKLAVRPGLGLRPYRPMRAVVGGTIVVGSVLAVWALMAKAVERRDVLMLARDVHAGQRIEAADLRVASIGSADSFSAVAATERDHVVGQYARSLLPAGDLLVNDDVQVRPLVSPGQALMSVAIPAGEVPVGMKAESRVALIVTLPPDCHQRPPVLVEATVVTVPAGLDRVRLESPRETVPVAVEVPQDYGAIVGTAAAVSVVVLQGDTPFPASEPQPTEPCPTAQLGVDDAAIGATAGTPPATGQMLLDVSDATIPAPTTTTPG